MSVQKNNIISEDVMYSIPICLLQNATVNDNRFPATRLIWVNYSGPRYGVMLDTKMNIINQYDLLEIARARNRQLNFNDNPMPEYNPLNALKTNNRDKELKSLCDWMGASIKYASRDVYCKYTGNTYSIIPNEENIYNQYEVAIILRDMRSELKQNNNDPNILPYYRPTRYDRGFSRFQKLCITLNAEYLGHIDYKYINGPSKNIYFKYDSNTFGVIPFRKDHIYNQHELKKIIDEIDIRMIPRNYQLLIKNYNPNIPDLAHKTMSKICNIIGAKFIGQMIKKYDI